jgi:hypothetical protein
VVHAVAWTDIGLLLARPASQGAIDAFDGVLTSIQLRSGSDQLRWLEIRTVAGPCTAVQWLLSGGPNTVSSHTRQVHVVCPPP